VVGVIKSRRLDFDPSLILQGYNCSQAEDAQQLLDGIRPTAEPLLRDSVSPLMTMMMKMVSDFLSCINHRVVEH